MKATIYQDSAGEWRWRLQARNNRIVATSGEGYTRKRDAIRAWDRVTLAFAYVRLGRVSIEVQEPSQ